MRCGARTRSRPGTPIATASRKVAAADRVGLEPEIPAAPACGVSEVCMACELQRRAEQLCGMMIDRVPAPALSHLRPALRLAGTARPFIDLQGCRVACAAARGRRTAPGPSAAPAGLGRPSSPRRADPAPALEAAYAPAGHPWHGPTLASSSRRPQMDLPASDGTAAISTEIAMLIERLAIENHGWGVPADPRRTTQARLPGSAHRPSAGS
jgi:hypothetical protein